MSNVNSKAVPKRVLEGIATAGDGKYPRMEQKVQRLTTCFWKLNPGHSLEKDSVLEWSMITRKDQMVRFNPDCFLMRFSAKHKNNNYSADAPVVEGKHTRTETTFLQPLEGNPPVYFPSALGPACFFEKLEVLINGMPVDAHSGVGPFSFVYQTQNRLYTKKEHRVRKYQADIPRVSTEVERQGDNPENYSEELKASMETLQFDDFLTSTDKVVRFGWDGVFPLDTQCNILRSLTGVEKSNGFLVPNTHITIRLHRRANLGALLERPHFEDAKYYSDDPVTASVHDVITFKISDLQLVFESLTLTDMDKMERMRKGTTRYFSDVPKVGVQAVQEGSMMTVNKVPIPKGTKVLLLTWMRGEQLFLKSASNKNMSARFSFIDGASNATFEVDGMGSLHFEKGFEDLGTEESHLSPTSRAYWKYLVSKGVYSGAFGKMFPKGTQRSYDQSVLFDFSYHQFSDPSEMTVTVKYTSDMSPKGWYLVATTVQQCLFTYQDGHELKYEVVV